MDRHTVGNRRTPACISACVEGSFKIKGCNCTVLRTANLERYFRGMAFGCRLHRLIAAIADESRSIELPCRQSNIGLEGNIQFRAKPATDRRRHDANVIN